MTSPSSTSLFACKCMETYLDYECLKIKEQSRGSKTTKSHATILYKIVSRNCLEILEGIKPPKVFGVGKKQKKNFPRKLLIKKNIFLRILAKKCRYMPREEKKFPPYMCRKKNVALHAASRPPITFLMVHP